MKVTTSEIEREKKAEREFDFLMEKAEELRRSKLIWGVWNNPQDMQSGKPPLDTGEYPKLASKWLNMNDCVNYTSYLILFYAPLDLDQPISHQDREEIEGKWTVNNFPNSKFGRSNSPFSKWPKRVLFGFLNHCL